MTSLALIVVFSFMQCMAQCNKVVSVPGIYDFFFYTCTSIWAQYPPDTQCQYRYRCIPTTDLYFFIHTFLSSTHFFTLVLIGCAFVFLMFG